MLKFFTLPMTGKNWVKVTFWLLEKYSILQIFFQGSQVYYCCIMKELKILFFLFLFLNTIKVLTKLT